MRDVSPSRGEASRRRWSYNRSQAEGVESWRRRPGDPGSLRRSGAMSTTRPTPKTDGSPSNFSGGAVGVTVFAAVFMILAGLFEAVQGLVALFNDTFYAVGQKYVFQFDVTSWGWIHLLLGIVVGLAGFFLLQGAVWARTVAVMLAAVSILANFLWMPYYPLWSITIIT